MERDPKILCLGVGVADPKGIFGTTLEARRRFSGRVLETPLSENMLTGACVGLALEGWKPVLVHARADFLLLTMEQLVNTAAKWPAMTNGRPMTVVVRAIVGRGWGQGPQHSQEPIAALASFPGVHVLVPVQPENAGKALRAGLAWSGLTVILEPRRLYELETLPFPDLLRNVGGELWLVAIGDIVMDALLVAKHMAAHGVEARVWPLEDVSAMELPPVAGEIPCVVADTGHLFCGPAAEVAARWAERGKATVVRMGPPFRPCPSAPDLERAWYPSPLDIEVAVWKALGKEMPIACHNNPISSLAADSGFRGPF